VIFFGLSLLLFICGLEFGFNLSYRINGVKLSRSKWTKINAKVVSIKMISEKTIRFRHGSTSGSLCECTVIYYVDGIKYKKHIISPDAVLQGKYVSLYYKNSKPVCIKQISRILPKKRNIPLAAFLIILSAISFISGCLIISELI
jgi:hypothetical protein